MSSAKDGYLIPSALMAGAADESTLTSESDSELVCRSSPFDASARVTRTPLPGSMLPTGILAPVSSVYLTNGIFGSESTRYSMPGLCGDDISIVVNFGFVALEGR